MSILAGIFVKYVGLKGFSKYRDDKAFTADEINKMARKEKIFVALNRVREADKIVDAAANLEVEGIILNEIAAINKLKGKRVVASVGLNALNIHDVELLRDAGASVVVIPPEVNEDVRGLKIEGVEIEAFKKAFVEMFYKGKCLLSAYFAGVSSKRDGFCEKECCRRWRVEYKGKSQEISFSPKPVEFEVDADILKFEGRQFSKVGVMALGNNNERP
jgi:putative protease